MVASGYSMNLCLYYANIGDEDNFIEESEIGLCLGVFFLFIQYIEYRSLDFSISDDVFGSFFYLFTGFHALHVIVGLLFLCVECNRFDSENASVTLNSSRHLGFTLAVIYWHFVDII